MLLRRITEHVKSQNWFAVGLDFIIVIFGVFVGLQVSNWNEERIESIRKKEILEDLLDDLSADQTSLTASSELVTLGIDAGNRLLIGAGLDPILSVAVPGQAHLFASESFDTDLPSPLTDDSDDQLWTHITVKIYPTHNDGTVESLIVTDNSSIIKNTSLFRDLLRYRSLWTGVEEANINTFRPIRDRTIFVGQEHGFSPVVPIDQDVLIEALRTDPTLRGALQTIVGYTIAQQAFYARVKKEAEALSERVKAELGQ